MLRFEFNEFSLLLFFLIDELLLFNKESFNLFVVFKEFKKVVLFVVVIFFWLELNLFLKGSSSLKYEKLLLFLYFKFFVL